MPKFIQQICVAFFLVSFHTPNFSNIYFSNEDDMLNYVKKLLPESPVILEAGGHHGEDTLRMKNIWENATIHVFEPLPSSYNTILQNTKSLSNIFTYPYALSNYTGITNFYINFHNDGASSINKPVNFNQHEFEKIPINVNCITIDNWAMQHNVSCIDFMWLDMEGHELFALKNSLRILSSVKAIYTEVIFTPVRENCCLYIDLKKFLESQGFNEICKLYYNDRFGNVLFLKN